MPEYELLYFPFSGLGEPLRSVMCPKHFSQSSKDVRLTFLVGGIPFKDRPNDGWSCLVTPDIAWWHGYVHRKDTTPATDDTFNDRKTAIHPCRNVKTWLKDLQSSFGMSMLPAGTRYAPDAYGLPVLMIDPRHIQILNQTFETPWTYCTCPAVRNSALPVVEVVGFCSNIRPRLWFATCLFLFFPQDYQQSTGCS